MPVASQIPVDASIVLLSRAQEGDSDALDALLKRYVPRLRRWYRGRLPRSARSMLDTYDVVQEAAIKFVSHLHAIEIRDAGSVKAFLRRTVSNRIIDLYRRASVRPTEQELDEEIASPEASPLQAAIGAETLRTYEEALRRLSLKDQRAIVMRVEMGCNYEEIALALNCTTPGAARVALSRALEKLAFEMQQA